MHCSKPPQFNSHCSAKMDKFHFMPKNEKKTCLRFLWSSVWTINFFLTDEMDNVNHTQQLSSGD